MKYLRFTLLTLVVMSFSQMPTAAQNTGRFALELATELNFSDFLLRANEQEVLWAQSGIEPKVQGQLGYGLTVSVVHPLSPRLALKVGGSAQWQRFRYRMDGFLTEADLLNNFNDPPSSTLKADFQFWSLDIPLVLECRFGPKRSILVNVGMGGRHNLTTSGNATLEGSDGTISTLRRPSYTVKNPNVFAQLGFGTAIGAAASSKGLYWYLYTRYFGRQEGLSYFEYTGHLIHTSFQVAYRF